MRHEAPRKDPEFPARIYCIFIPQCLILETKREGAANPNPTTNQKGNPMADHEDHIFADLLLHMSVVYTALTIVSLKLPIAITLPGVPEDKTATHTAHIGSDLAIPAIRRAMELNNDQPMPEEWKDTYLSACAHFLAAADVLSILSEDFHPARALSVTANLMVAEDDLLSLAQRLGGKHQH